MIIICITYGDCTICIRPYFDQTFSGNIRQKHPVSKPIWLCPWPGIQTKSSPEGTFKPVLLCFPCAINCFYSEKWQLVQKLWSVREHLLIFSEEIFWEINIILSSVYFYMTKKREKMILNTIKYLCWWLSL